MQASVRRAQENRTIQNSSGVLNVMRRCTNHEGTTFFVELLEEFPRIILTKIRLKILPVSV
jgi:hypothetical protein